MHLKRFLLKPKYYFKADVTPKMLHYKFCLEFLGALFLSEVDKDFEEEWGRILRTTADISFKAINALDMIFMAYVEQRRFQF